MTLTIARPERQNSISAALIREIGAALDEAEQSSSCRIVVLRGEPGCFCTGLDFRETIEHAEMPASDTVEIDKFMELLRRFSLSPKIIVSIVDGRVIAGGVGLVAASDLVLATNNSEFSLSEALWGLLPCCVVPYLIRRIGFQKCYSMTMTTLPISAEEAYRFSLVDELTDNPDDSLRKLLLRLNLLEEETILELKQYFRKMWIVTSEMEQTAVREITRLSSKPQVKRNITDFIALGRFPWHQRESR
jgi:polyketide biosynthesis enoyl-CoA hydratase PksH